MPEKKVSDKKRASNDAWDSKNMKRMSLAMRADEYDVLKEHIDKISMNANAFIRQAIKEKIEADNAKG